MHGIIRGYIIWDYDTTSFGKWYEMRDDGMKILWEVSYCQAAMELLFSENLVVPSPSLHNMEKRTLQNFLILMLI